MESYTRITSITNDITTSYVNTIWRLNDKAFTRNRKMNYESLVKTIILKKVKHYHWNWTKLQRA